MRRSVGRPSPAGRPVGYSRLLVGVDGWWVWAIISKRISSISTS